MIKKIYGIKISYKLLITLLIILVLLFIFGNFFIPPYITNISTSDSIRNKEEKIINVEVDNYFFKIDKTTWCILSSDEEIPDKNDANWIKASNGYCSFIVKDSNYTVFVKDRYGNINNLNNQKNKIKETAKVKVSKDVVYLYKDGQQKITGEIISGNKDNETISWISDNDEIATVDENGLITGKKSGSVTIRAEVNNNTAGSVKVIVSDLITKPDTNTQKKYLTCKQFKEDEANLLDTILFDRIEDAGYKTRAGVVEAARFLTLEFSYRVPYFYENGRLNNYAPYKYVDGEGRYYHRGLYLSSAKIKDLKASFVGPAIWGCDLQNYTDWNGVYITGKLYPNGLDCSGFVTWALLNGGFDVGDIGAGPDSNRLDLTDLGEKIPISNELMESGKVKVGDLIGLSGHMAILAGIDENNYYIAESLNTTGGVVITTVAKNKLVNNSIYKYIVLMDKVYKEDGNLTNMW